MNDQVRLSEQEVTQATQGAQADSTTTVTTKVRKFPVLSLITLIAYLAMVTVNALANLLPINQITTGAVSDDYSNLFAPAGITFAIWGLIYLLLAVFVVRQFFPVQAGQPAKRLQVARICLIISSVANATWIFAWHYREILASLILMLIILICLIVARVRLGAEKMTLQEAVLVRLPFSVYFGWITVATVANVTTYLVDLGWDRFGLSEAHWMVVILAVATLLALGTIVRFRDWAYGAVIVWAFAGILIKHVDPTVGFAGRHLAVIITVSVCLGLVASASVLAILAKKIMLVSDRREF